VKIRKTSVYKTWIKKLRDSRAKYRILIRVKRLEMGNPGDIKPAGNGISEIRIDYGPGYRVYFKGAGKETIVLLCGGDKSTQEADIASAKQIASLPLEEEELKDGKNNGK
jgi:putative addiction module killer protein